MASGSSIIFNENDLFPFIDRARYDYREAKLHSKQVDDYLGFQITDIEAALSFKKTNHEVSVFEATERWIGLDPSALQTPYTEIRLMLSELNLRTGQSVIDLGAGYGRMAFVIGTHFQGVHFTGYEISGERVTEANRVLSMQGLAPQMIEQDLSSGEFKLPEADVYFIYDFGTLPSIVKILDDLKTIARIRPVKVIGRGRRVRDEIERHQMWLSQIVEPIHHANFSIYRSHA